jgi:hypothetical protein
MDEAGAARRGFGVAATASMCALVIVAIAASGASASTWTVTKFPDDQVHGPMFGVSCPSPELCVVGGSDNLIATSTNPTGGASAWNVFHPGGTEQIPEIPGLPPGGKISFPGAQVRGISCPSPTLCVGVTLDGRIFSSTDPTGGASAWKIVQLGAGQGPNLHMTGISCPSPGLCLAVAYGSKVVYSTDPTGDASAWAVTELATPLDFRGVSCPTPSFCAAVDNEGSIATSVDPTGGALAWSLVGRPGGLNALNGISCPSPSLCVTGNAGQMITSTSPANAASWTAVAAGTGLPVKGVSCPLESACAAVDNNSDAIVSTDPTGGSSAWSFANVIPKSLDGSPNGMFGLSCPTTTLCVAVGQNEQIISSTNPFASDPVKAQPGGSKRPRVVITGHPAKRVRPHKGGVKVTFRFHATRPVTRFKCKLSGRHFRACKSPRRYRVGKGTYTFKVRAIAPSGIKGPPATFHFRVGRLTEGQPVGSCRTGAAGPALRPCINAR